jgi:glycosyltransferase involved in cell wall biosynthesis
MDKRTKFFFIASFGSKKKHLNGESIKSRDVLACLRERQNVVAFNLDDHKIRNFLFFCITVFFNRRRRVLICKAPTGAKILLNYLHIIHYPKRQIVAYIYGFGLFGEYAEKVIPQDFSYLNSLIVESPLIVNQFMGLGPRKILVFPCLKRIYKVEENFKFAQKKVLHLLFFSRIIESKGVLEIAEAVIEANQPSVRFDLSFAGDTSGEPETLAKLNVLVRSYPFLHLLGESFIITGRESYQRFSAFDLHVFPSHFFHECAPGSIVDSFIAGVPTLSTKFHSYEQMLDDSFAYLADGDTKDDFILALNQIYNNQRLLWEKRQLCLAQTSKYTFSTFYSVLEESFN